MLLSISACVPYDAGRKHQLRIHCADVLGCTIVGDYKYGYKDFSRTAGAYTRSVPISTYAASVTQNTP